MFSLIKGADAARVALIHFTRLVPLFIIVPWLVRLLAAQMMRNYSFHRKAGYNYVTTAAPTATHGGAID